MIYDIAYLGTLFIYARREPVEFFCVVADWSEQIVLMKCKQRAATTWLVYKREKINLLKALLKAYQIFIYLICITSSLLFWGETTPL